MSKDGKVWDTVKKAYLKAEEKAEKYIDPHGSGEDPEEELAEELDELEEDEELKREEDFIDEVAEEDKSD